MMLSNDSTGNQRVDYCAPSGPREGERNRFRTAACFFGGVGFRVRSLNCGWQRFFISMRLPDKAAQDRDILRLWQAPETHTMIRDYLQKTLGKKRPD